jgi:Ca2+-transporting ATPase
MEHLNSVDAPYTGLNAEEVLLAREKFGTNATAHQAQNGFWVSLWGTVKEPMFLLLVLTAIIYFVSGQTGDGLFMAASMLIVIAISLYQETRSSNALQALKTLSQPKAQVIRGGQITLLNATEIVLGDIMVLEEGTLVPADGILLQSNDFQVNESIITGESFTVYKTETGSDKNVFQGTLVADGRAICKVTAIGAATQLGKIGKALQEAKTEDTPLQKQINHFVRMMALIGCIVFVMVWGINYYHSRLLSDSLLKALTLAMSILPEEIPVAFATFMALGAMRLMQLGIIVKRTQTVETLGSASVICIDKTGTITRNKMALAKVYLPLTNSIVNVDAAMDAAALNLISTAMWASEPVPFDPMEMALHECYAIHISKDERQDYKMVHEYPLSGKPPMMTHVFENAAGNRIVAAKGAVEAFLNIIPLSNEAKQNIINAANTLAASGLRVLAVGKATVAHQDYPENQQDLKFELKGLLAFFDPPKDGVADVFKAFYQAGIQVKIITGDNALTTQAIAKQVNFKGANLAISGDELMHLNEQEWQVKVNELNLFTRMFPEAKLRIIKALKANHQVVAMTGDGVNDGPALKSAHIGIAMGKRGSEIARDAASLILADDDLSKMVDAVAMGRKIYSNLKKAIQYIISIHIPIIMVVSMPLFLGWIYPNIFTPVHVIFLELIMGPTCSIIYENEPLEKNLMLQAPRPFTTTFFNARELLTSIIQGLFIAFCLLSLYQIAVHQSYNCNQTRTLIFVALITANVLLTLVNRSFVYSVITTLTYKNKLVPLIIGITIALTCLTLFVAPLMRFFQFYALTGMQFTLAITTGAISVLWFEIVKWVRRLRMQ